MVQKKDKLMKINLKIKTFKKKIRFKKMKIIIKNKIKYKKKNL